MWIDGSGKMKEKENNKIPKELLKKYNMPIYSENWNKRVRPRCFDSRNELQRSSEKVVTLEQAIRASGLKDGMTISFHHHFREGDHVVNLVIDKLAEMGFKNLTIAPSSLSDVHAPLIEHIKNGVITKINTSGLRGKLPLARRQGGGDKGRRPENRRCLSRREQLRHDGKRQRLQPRRGRKIGVRLLGLRHG